MIPKISDLGKARRCFTPQKLLNYLYAGGELFESWLTTNRIVLLLAAISVIREPWDDEGVVIDSNVSGCVNV